MVVGGELSRDLGQRATQRGFDLRCRPVVHGDREALVLEQDARRASREVEHGQARAIKSLPGRCVAMQLAARITPFEAVQACGGPASRRKQLVQRGDRASTDERHGSVEGVCDIGEQLRQVVVDAHRVGRGSDLEQRPVHVQEQAPGFSRDVGARRYGSSDRIDE